MTVLTLTSMATLVNAMSFECIDIVDTVSTLSVIVKVSSMRGGLVDVLAFASELELFNLNSSLNICISFPGSYQNACVTHFSNSKT